MDAVSYHTIRLNLGWCSPKYLAVSFGLHIAQIGDLSQDLGVQL